MSLPKLELVVNPLHAIGAYMGSGSTSPLVLNFGDKWGGLSKPFYPRQRISYSLQRRMGGSQSRFGRRMSIAPTAI